MTDLPKLKGCDSTPLYYGYTTKPDYVQARQCAYFERGTGGGEIIGGSAILTMIYANGFGVPRNLPLAIKFACEAGGAPAEIEGRISDLNHLQNNQPSSNQRPYDFCDDTTSGYMQGACEGITTDADKAKRQAQVDTLTKTYSPEQKKALTALQRAAKAYFKAHADNEVDLSGTDRGMVSLEDQDGNEDTFIADLQSLESNKIPGVSATQFARVDAHLNAVYQHVLANPAFKLYPGSTPDDPMSNMGTITPDGIRADQRLWLAYRNAWVHFAALRRPDITRSSLMAWITNQRIEDLRTLLPSTDPDYRQPEGEH